MYRRAEGRHNRDTMNPKRQLIPRQPLRRLQWKMVGLFMLAATLTTLLTQATLTAIVVYLLILSSNPLITDVENGLREGQTKALRFFAGAAPDRFGLSRMLDHLVLTDDQTSEEIQFHFMEVSGGKFRAAVADAQGQVLASSPDETTFPVGKPLASCLTPEERRLVEEARTGDVRAHWQGTRIIGAGALRRDGKIIAMAFVRSQPVYTNATWHSLVTNVVGALIMSLIATGIVGGAVGYVVARSVTKRLQAISGAADSWGSGDFEATAPETPGDELGLLAQRLNLMARDLRQMIGLKNAVAALEERQRITRDLHDTIKQEAFATAMMVGSAQQCLEAGDEAGMRRALGEAFELSRQMQTDLSGILMQLKTDAAPIITERLESIAAAWRRRSGLSVRWQARCATDGIAPLVAEQAARIADEAVANAVKHSGGQLVTITLERDSDAYRLMIADDGIGFDPATARKGMGLGTMQERAGLLPGGRLEIISRAEGGGTQVTLYFL